MVEKKEAPKKAAPRKAAPKKEEPKKEEPSLSKAESMAKEAEGHINEHTHALLKTHWQAAHDALVQVVEAEKRYDLLYGDGRITEGKDANKNLARETKNRVE
jgi:hypothetical protein